MLPKYFSCSERLVTIKSEVFVVTPGEPEENCVCDIRSRFFIIVLLVNTALISAQNHTQYQLDALFLSFSLSVFMVVDSIIKTNSRG